MFIGSNLIIGFNYNKSCTANSINATNYPVTGKIY